MFVSTLRRAASVSTRRAFAAPTFASRALSSAASSSSSSSGKAKAPPIYTSHVAKFLAATAVFATAYHFGTKPSSAEAQTGLSPKEFNKFKLKKRIKYNHNTDVFIFDLADPKAELNLPVSSFLVTRFKGADGKDVIRPYTPLSAHGKGELYLLVKDYPQGNMSRHFHTMKEGDMLEMKGPLPKFPYEANSKKVISMIAGGTGITPMLQIMEEIARNPSDKTEVRLLFANQSSQDILLQERIEDLQRLRPDTFKVQYLIDKPESGWKGPTGYINADLLRKLDVLPKPSKDVMVLVCGPPPMMKVTSGMKTPDFKQGEVDGALKELGFNSDNVFKV